MIMKKPVILSFAATLLTLFPSLSFAVDMEYYSYGGYQAVQQAFTNLALIFSDNSYMALYGMALIMGIVFGGTAVYAKIVSGANINPLSFVPPVVIGIAVYTVFIVPKGTIHLYDPVYDATDTIGNIPDGIVILAGSLNLIERKAVELIDTSIGLPNNSQQSGGAGWLGLYNASQRSGATGRPWIDSSLNRYVADCVSFELTLYDTALTVQELRGTDSGAPQTNFINSLEKANNPAVDTVMYSAANDNVGSAVSCAEAWAALKPQLNDKTNFDAMEMAARRESGFGGGDPFSDRVMSALSLSGMPGGLADTKELMRQMYIAKSLDTYLKQGNTTAITNYQFMQNATGSMSAANTWLPWIRACLLAITIGMVPFLALFIPTPLCTRVVSLVCGLFIFNAIWGISDTVVQSFIFTFADKTFQGVQSGSFGMDGIYFMPQASVKLLGIFGMLRMSGMTFATVVTGMLVKFGGSAMAHMASGVTGGLQGAGQAGATMTESPAGQASAIKANVDASPTMAWANKYDFGERATASAAGLFGGTASTLGAVDQAGGLSPYVQASSTDGRVQQSKKQGGNATWQKAQAIAASMGMSQANADMIQGKHHNPAAFMTTMQRLQRQAGDMNLSGDEAAQMYFQGQLQTDMAGSSTGESHGFTMTNAVDGKGGSVQTATKGNVSATFGNHRLTNVSGMNPNIKASDGTHLSYTEKIADSKAQTATYQQQVGSSIVQALSNSSTKQSMDALAKKSSVVNSGTHAVKKAIETGVANSIDKAQTITDSHGNVIEKGSDAWSSVSAQAKMGVEAFGTGGGVTIDAGGKMTVGIKTKDGHEYKVSFDEKETRSLTQRAGEEWTDATVKSKGVEKSATDTSAVAEAQTITGSRSAQESLTASEQRTQMLENALSATKSKGLDNDNNLNAAFANFVGDKYFGGGEQGALKAINYLNDLGSQGTAGSQAALKGLMSEFVESNALTPLKSDMPAVQGPENVSVPSFQGAKDTIKPAADKLVDAQGRVEHPNGAPVDLRDQINNFRPQQGVGGPNKVGYQRYMAQVKDNLSVAGDEWKKLNADPMAPTEQFFGLKAVPTAEGVSQGYVYQNPSFFEGIGDTAAGVANNAVKGALPVLSWDSGGGNRPSASDSANALGEMFAGNIGYKPPGSPSSPGGITLLGGDKKPEAPHSTPSPAAAGQAMGDTFRDNLGYRAPGGSSKPGSFTLLGG